MAAFLVAMTPLPAAESQAVVRKPSVAVHSAPDFSSPTVTTLSQNASVTISGQRGLWFQVGTPKGAGFVRVDDVRMAYAGKENGDANLRALFTGKAGKGRVTETAGVRGLDESDLKS
ncbi:MAG TPA: SH3 domain-containing protein, partial [Luteimonas sp.]|nr:SH3 domain-containing protein [Luteimonas sp.]